MSYRISRKIINEMVKREQNISSRRSSGGSGAGGGGGVSSAWVDEHYVSKDFFARLFTIHSDVVTEEDPHGEVVEPNDLETDIDNIEMMFGSWTEHYLSALGQGSGGGGGGGALLTEPLASINEAGMGTPSGANKVIVWNGSTWTYMPYATGSGTVTSVTMTVPTGFKVSNGDTKTINTTGSFDLTFGGTITKNRVLASPAAANGTPAWRALVADDIPTLTAAKISDITLTNGTLTIGNNSITPITDATLKSDYSWWGQKLNSSGKVKGDLYMLIDGGGLNDDSARLKFNSGSVDSSDTVRRSPYIQAIHTGGYGKKRLSVFQSDASDYTTAFVEVMSILSNGRVGIGTTSPSVLFDVNGYAKTTRLYLASGVYLEYDSSNSGVHLVGAGLYADTYLSALGAGSGGGGGSTLLTEPLASINEAGLGTPSANKVIVSTSNGWAYMPYTTGGSGSVTSVGLSMPTGFNVTNTPVTGSGTLTVAFGGSVSKNRVLAAPSDAAGAPSWRKLVAADIPDLSGTYAAKSDVTTLQGYFDTSGNAKSALKLTTVSKTAWGQTYWTSGGVPTNVSGTIIVGNGDIVMNNNKNIYFIDNPSEGSPAQKEVLRLSSGNNLLIGYGTATVGYNTRIYGNSISFRYGTSGTQGMVLRSTGHLTINASDDTDTTRNIYLNVGGNVKATKFYFTNSVYLEYDSSNSGVHLVGAGLYADTYLSALGAGSGGGSGSGITMADVWDALAATAPSVSSQQIDITHLISVSTYYATKTWANSNFVTLTGAQTITGEKTFSADIKPSGYGYNLGASDKRWSNVYCNYCNTQYNATVGGTLTVNGTINSLSITTETPSIASAVSSTKVSSQSRKALWCYSDTLLYASGSWISTSDVRKKDIMEHVEASVEQIAKTSVFNYRMKDDKSGNISLGTSAQEWQKIFPTTVKTMPDGFLGFDYASAALGASVMAAREIVRLKKRIEDLEKKLKTS